MKILVTGGTGFIGSHTCCELLEPQATRLLANKTIAINIEIIFFIIKSPYI